MMRRLLLPVLGGAAALALVAQTQAMSAPRLNGTVGSGFTISLKDSTGKNVTTLKPGQYTFVINDKSNIHSFVLERESPKSPKFEKELSSVGAVGLKKPVTYNLAKGKYKFYCAPHESQMFGFFTVK